MRDFLHRPGSEQTVGCNEIFKARRFQFTQKTAHPPRFKLEDANGIGIMKVFKNGRIIQVDGIQIDGFSMFFFNHMHRVLEDRQRAQPQKVHFQQTQFLQLRHGILCGHGTAVDA